MNATSNAPVRNAPQRRKRGTSSSAPPNVSPIPSSTADGRLTAAGSLACARRAAAPNGSVIFHTPATIKSAARSTAAATLARQLPLGRRSAVIALSLGFFAGVVVFAGRKLLRATSAVDGDGQSPPIL